MEEIWKPVENFPNYSISSIGRLRTEPNGKIRKASISKKGYPRYGLYNGSKKQPIYIAAHRLVASAFIPNTQNKPTVNHIDGVKTNNCVLNLEWNTVAENVKHSYATGLNVFPRGSKHFASKIDEESVVMIRRLYGGKIPQWRIGKIFGINQQNVSLICSGKAWAHVKQNVET
jgi:hypothetical protein